MSLSSLFPDLPHPFDHAKAEIRLRAYLLEKLPQHDDLGETYEAAKQLVGNLMAVYVRAVDGLCLIAEEAETTAGLSTLEFPGRSA